MQIGGCVGGAAATLLIVIVTSNGSQHEPKQNNVLSPVFYLPRVRARRNPKTDNLMETNNQAAERVED